MTEERENLKRKLAEKIAISDKLDLSDLGDLDELGDLSDLNSLDELEVALDKKDWTLAEDDEIKQALSSIHKRAQKKY